MAKKLTVGGVDLEPLKECGEIYAYKLPDGQVIARVGKNWRLGPWGEPEYRDLLGCVMEWRRATSKTNISGTT